MKKGTLTNVILILVLIIGLSLLLYPTISDYWNSMHQSRAIASYAEQVSVIEKEDYDHIWEDALAYNDSLLERGNSYTLTDEQKADYDRQLKVVEDSVMGYIEIPSIKCSLPIYHGTDEANLQVAVGHLDWTSLPTGGASTHSVISGHRGLPRARLFTDLDQLVIGDHFLLHVLDEVLTYEVDQIRIVEPHVTEDLLIVEGKDLCTLVTCTPYGVNSHRLLVRGHRVENAEEAVTVRLTADAIELEPTIVAVILFGPILLVLVALMLVADKIRRDHKT